MKTSKTNFFKDYKPGMQARVELKNGRILDVSGMVAWDSKDATTFENFKLLYENGVSMTTGNDTMPPCTPAKVGLEVRMFDHVLEGKSGGKQLSAAGGVKIATINSARSMGLDRDIGSIETGKIGDLVVLDGDPIEDLRLIGNRVPALVMDGKLVINNCGLEVESNTQA